MKKYVVSDIKAFRSQYVPDTEISRDFITMMVSRMEQSYFKYGAIHDAFPNKIDAIQTCLEYIRKYKEDGNAERLVDAANYLMIEFIAPKHKTTHFRATNSEESLGRKVMKQSRFDQRPNLEETATEQSALNYYKRKEGD